MPTSRRPTTTNQRTAASGISSPWPRPSRRGRAGAAVERPAARPGRHGAGRPDGRRRGGRRSRPCILLHGGADAARRPHANPMPPGPAASATSAHPTWMGATRTGPAPQAARGRRTGRAAGRGRAHAAAPVDGLTPAAPARSPRRIMEGGGRRAGAARGRVWTIGLDGRAATAGRSAGAGRAAGARRGRAAALAGLSETAFAAWVAVALLAIGLGLARPSTRRRGRAASFHLVALLGSGAVLAGVLLALLAAGRHLQLSALLAASGRPGAVVGLAAGLVVVLGRGGAGDHLGRAAGWEPAGAGRVSDAAPARPARPRPRRELPHAGILRLPEEAPGPGPAAPRRLRRRGHPGRGGGAVGRPRRAARQRPPRPPARLRRRLLLHRRLADDRRLRRHRPGDRRGAPGQRHPADARSASSSGRSSSAPPTS